MREILFRGKTLNHTCWAYGDYVHRRGEPLQECIALGFEKNGAIKLCDVYPNTVGQFTGLNDSKARKIFEGDIILITDRMNGIKWKAVVVFGNPNGEYSWGWELKPIGKFDGNKDILLWIEMEDTQIFCEIIGNIYDNPDLLEVSKNE